MTDWLDPTIWENVANAAKSRSAMLRAKARSAAKTSARRASTSSHRLLPARRAPSSARC